MYTRSFRLVITLLLLLTAYPSCGSPAPSPEDMKKIKALRSELEKVRSEIAAAEMKNSSLAGGLVKALVEARIEILKTTESLIQQRIQAIESGAKITIEVVGTEPNEELAKQLQQEIKSQEVELNAAREDVAKYSGGLVAAMKEATVATQEQTLAMLQQRYLSAKYGLATIIPTETAGTGSERKTLSEPSSATLSTNLDASPEINAEIISVKLLRKEYAEQDYQDYIWFDLEFTAKGLDKPARAIKGILNLQDLFGEPYMRINWTIDKPMKPGDTLLEKEKGFKYNQFSEPHQWVRVTEIENMTASFTVKSILYQDGSRRDF